MRKFMTSLLLAGALSVFSQTLNVVEGPVTYRFPSTQTSIMPYTDGTTVSIMDRSFNLAGINNMYVDLTPVTDNLVTVEYTSAGATVSVAGNIARYIETTVDGAHVTIAQSVDVDDATCGEITYRLSGVSTDGSFAMSGSFKSTIELDGLNLASSSGAPLDIQDSKRIELIVNDGTVNALTDSEGGSQKGCIVCKGHLEFRGSGKLTVTGNTSHAIYAKEYIELKSSEIVVDKAVKDGLNCNQYFRMESGSINISGVGDDGVQVSFKDDTDHKAEDTGTIFILGGTVNATATADASKALKADGNITVEDGELTLKVTGNGVYDSAKTKTKASSCLNADGCITIGNGTLSLTAEGSGGKGISCDSVLTINGGTINIITTGGATVYTNNTLTHNYTGNLDYIASDMKSSPKGIKADGDININGGTIKVKTAKSEGIESKAVLTINDGDIYVEAYDDAINSSSHMYIKGGTVTVVASSNDGLDSNGNLYISGGTVVAFGSSQPECGLDANEEDGYTVVFTGGKILGVGGGNSVPSSSSGSTQPYVSGSGSVTAGSVIKLSGGGETLAEFTVPEAYKSSGGGWGGPGGGWGGNQSSSILVSCPGLVSGTSYTLTNGTSTSSVKAVVTGNSGRPW